MIPPPPPPSPPPPPLPPSALMCKKPSTLLSLLSQAKTGPGRGDETSSSLKGLCFISEDFVMSGRAGTRGKPSHALVEMYTQPIKIVITAAHFSLRGITPSSTAKKDLDVQSRLEEIKNMKGYLMLGELPNWRAAHFQNAAGFFTLMLRGGKGLHCTGVIQEHRITAVTETTHWCKATTTNLYWTTSSDNYRTGSKC